MDCPVKPTYYQYGALLSDIKRALTRHERTKQRTKTKHKKKKILKFKFKTQRYFAEKFVCLCSLHNDLATISLSSRRYKRVNKSSVITEITVGNDKVSIKLNR